MAAGSFWLSPDIYIKMKVIGVFSLHMPNSNILKNEDLTVSIDPAEGVGKRLKELRRSKGLTLVATPEVEARYTGFIVTLEPNGSAGDEQYTHADTDTLVFWVNSRS